MSVEIQRQIAALMRKTRDQKEGRKLQIIVHPTVLERLRKEDEAILVDLENKFAGYLSFRGDPAKHIEAFEIRNAETGELLHGAAAT